MTATIYPRNGRWFAYDNGVIFSADTRAELVRALRLDGWTIREAYS